MDAAPRYIAVEGPIGVGKTSLVRRLADSLGSEPLMEAAEDNPFLERFYREGSRAALPTQLSFLFQRKRQIEALSQGDMFRPGVVADFMMEKDRIFAEVTLDHDEFRLYEKVYSAVGSEPTPVPDLVIYLQAPVDVLLSRVGARGIPYERGIDRAYLSRLTEAYTRFFYHYEAAPLLIVNAAGIDLVNSDSDYKLLLREVQSVHRGKHYFNPAPIAL